MHAVCSCDFKIGFQRHKNKYFYSFVRHFDVKKKKKINGVTLVVLHEIISLEQNFFMHSRTNTTYNYTAACSAFSQTSTKLFA